MAKFKKKASKSPVGQALEAGPSFAAPERASKPPAAAMPTPSRSTAAMKQGFKKGGG